MFFRYRKHLTMTALVALGLLFFVIFSPKAICKISDPEAIDAIKAVSGNALYLQKFQAEFNLIRQDNRLLEAFYPQTNGFDKTAVRGVIKYTKKAGVAELYFQEEGINYYVFQLLDDSLQYSGYKRIRNLLGKSVEESNPEDFNLATPTPTPGVIPSATPSPSPSPDLSGYWIRDAHPSSKNYLSGHPLYYMLPFSLQTHDAKDRFFLKAKSAPILGYNCKLVEVTNATSPYKTLLWIDEKQGQVIQIERTNNELTEKITATYLGFFAEDEKYKFAPYNRVKVELNNMPLYLAELAEPKINLGDKNKKSKREIFSDESFSTIRRTTQIISDEVIPILSENALNFVILLCMALFVLFIRFMIFRMTRQEFSDELLVVDEEDGRFIELLDKLGYKISPFSAEALAFERDLLGKGATEDTTYRPRALIIAPESFKLVKDYMFLVRAYVEEGGRVLVMYHPQKMSSSLPYMPELLPLPNANTGISFNCKEGVFTSLNIDSIKRVANAYSGQESYLKVDQKPLNVSLLTATNKDTDVTSNVIGVARHGKGEYIICQLRFTAGITSNSKPMQLILNDLLRYVLGLEPIVYEDEIV